MTSTKSRDGSRPASRGRFDGSYVLWARLLAATALLTLATTGAAPRGALADPEQAMVVAQAQGTEPRELQPRYEPAPPEEKSSYNATYVFGLTRSVAYMPWSPAAKTPLFLFTLPLDIVLLPFAAIGGFFG